MWKRTYVLLLSIITITGAMASLPTPVCAKPGPFRIRGWSNSIEGRYASRGKDSVYLTLDSVTMLTAHDNPLIIRRIYMAAGETTDRARFTEVRRIEQRLSGEFEYGGKIFRWDLSKEGSLFGLDTLLRDLPGGYYTFYATADDGQGEGDPANFITLELPPSPSAVLSAPVIEEATSPAIGLAVLRLAPMQFSGSGDPTMFFNVYRADGRTTDPSEFRVLQIGPKPSDAIDTVRGGIGYVREIAVARMKSGEASFYVAVKTEPGAGKEMLTSNIVSVRVEGSRTTDDPIVKLAHIAPPSAVHVVDLQREMAGAVYPNPAADIVWIPLPGGAGEAAIRIVDARGEIVLESRSSADGAHVAIDCAALPPGPYWASITRGRRSLLRGLVIAR